MLCRSYKAQELSHDHLLAKSAKHRYNEDHYTFQNVSTSFKDDRLHLQTASETAVDPLGLREVGDTAP